MIDFKALAGWYVRIMMVRPAKGQALDALAAQFGIVRKRWLWIFRESDRSLRHRTQRACLDTLTRSEAVQALYRLRRLG